MDDFKWIKDIVPLPMGLSELLNMPHGEYRMWLGDVPREKQLVIIDYIISTFEKTHKLSRSTHLIRNCIDSGEYNVNSIFIFNWGGKLTMTKMSHGVCVWDGRDLDYCRNYFHSKEISDEVDVTHLLKGYI